jgi:molybdenum cofactor cytidylyltransferase
LSHDLECERQEVLAKGHIISEEDTLMLEVEDRLMWVAEVEEGEIREDDAVMKVAREIGRGAPSVQLAAGGGANIFATEQCVLADYDLLRQINYTASVAIATSANSSHAKAGQRVGTVKCTPIAVPKMDLDVVISIIKQNGPILQARPIRSPSAAVLYTDPTGGTQARKVFEKIMCQRLEPLGISASFVLASVEEEASVARSLRHLLRLKSTFILITSLTTPAGPCDVVNRALLRAECRLERFRAPVDPGALLMLGYKDDIPIVSAPGYFRSINPNACRFGTSTDAKVIPPVSIGCRLPGLPGFLRKGYASCSLALLLTDCKIEAYDHGEERTDFILGAKEVKCANSIRKP